jgi:hypothetical protein
VDIHGSGDARDGNLLSDGQHDWCPHLVVQRHVQVALPGTERILGNAAIEIADGHPSTRG